MVTRLMLPDGVFPVLGYTDESAGWTELATLDPGAGYDWEMYTKSTTVTMRNQRDYLILRIMDRQDFKSVIDQTEAVAYDGYVYKVSSIKVPFGVPHIWELRLVRTEDAP